MMSLYMKLIANSILSIFALATVAFAEDPRAAMRMETAQDSVVAETFSDIKSTLGLVPDFFKVYPQQALPGAWQAFKAVQLNPHSAIPSKYKELIGLAVSSQIPCHYCVFFHSEAARGNGASDSELQEAVALAGVERQWSTIINGAGTDREEFRSWADNFFERVADNESKINFNAKPAANAEEAYADMRQTFGDLPPFVEAFPKAGIAGAWTELKMLSFNPNTAVPVKYKDLISLAVSAQIPCEHCVYFDTKSARADGASEDEINEAIAMASMSRHWSTVLNGVQTDEAQFKKQMKQVFAYAQKSAKEAAAQNQAKS